MIRAVALVDLDDTLFQTLRKRPPGVPEARMTPLAYAIDGAPLSYATPSQLALLEWLSDTCRVVPVTARSLGALRRVRMPYAAAVCAHGAVLLTDEGCVDEDWAAEIAVAAAPYAGALEALADAVRSQASAVGVDLSVRVQAEAGVPLYVLAKHPAADADALHRVADAVQARAPEDWRVHRNDNNVAWMPPYLGKAAAVRRLLPRLRTAHPDLPVIGVGDSLTDAPFMALCDFAMTPTGSQLAGALLR